MDTDAIKIPEFAPSSAEPLPAGLLRVSDLSENQGFRMGFAAPKIAPEKVRDLDGQKYVEAKEVTKSGGRLLYWKLKANIESARARGWLQITPNLVRDGVVAICGSGPSIGRFDQLREIRRLQKKGASVHAINRCHDFLITKGIVPNSASLLDPIPHVRDYIKPRAGVRYYIGSQCDPGTFDVFDRPQIDKVVWHCRTTKEGDSYLTEEELMYAVPSRTSTNGLRSVMLKYFEGYRHFHFFGFDSSYETYRDDAGELKIVLAPDGKGRLHAHAKPETIHDVRPARIREEAKDGTVVFDRDYFSNSAMLSQTEEFRGLVSDVKGAIANGYMDQVFFYVHGDGLLPDLAASAEYGFHIDRKRNRKHG